MLFWIFPQLIAVLKTKMAHCVLCKQSWRKSNLSVFSYNKKFSKTDFLCDFVLSILLTGSFSFRGWMIIPGLLCVEKPHLCGPFIASCSQPACSRGSSNCSHMANLAQMSVRNAASHPAYAPCVTSSLWTPPLLSANISFSSPFFPK